ncbi:hypothetical protein ALP50_01486 [Pseudomonas syringae pv. spinaceae]|uniref:Uncharacterized protein n=1 Tax=Pseudomonas syringae pv. spinaceae TaxID=264459 RepID=A0A0Q0I5E8_PSESX|nr:hypothetical protein [Pseudomonas syringae]KPY96084.1 Uncharacterized protein ALO94_01423 [Pseudomonas syringae pv. spinaceae]RMT25553.1 hypothetical protein ALP50_01486 [Pseudomonas syringae pv. spinaceae]
MCNAWNHPKNCSCGWGGDGHTGRSINAFSAPATHSDRFISLANTYHSYINPNASCPVCGAAVFFYQSAGGGRVFFDELGPPWPKHPCTDNTDRPVHPPLTSMMSGQPASYAWQRAGWQPFFIEAVTGIDKDYIKLTGISQGQRLSLYLRRLVTHHAHHQLSEHNLAHIKVLSDSHFQLSVMLPQGSPITVIVYSQLAQARSGQSPPADSTKPNALNNRTIRPSSSHRHTVQREPKKKSVQPSMITAMAVAFRKAQEYQDRS